MSQVCWSYEESCWPSSYDILNVDMPVVYDST
jgi:hypothetical protein